MEELHRIYVDKKTLEIVLNIYKNFKKICYAVSKTTLDRCLIDVSNNRLSFVFTTMNEQLKMSVPYAFYENDFKFVFPIDSFTTLYKQRYSGQMIVVKNKKLEVFVAFDDFSKDNQALCLQTVSPSLIMQPRKYNNMFSSGNQGKFNSSEYSFFKSISDRNRIILSFGDSIALASGTSALFRENHLYEKEINFIEYTEKYEFLLSKNISNFKIEQDDFNTYVSCLTSNGNIHIDYICGKSNKPPKMPFLTIIKSATNIHSSMTLSVAQIKRFELQAKGIESSLVAGYSKSNNLWNIGLYYPELNELNTQSIEQVVPDEKNSNTSIGFAINLDNLLSLIKLGENNHITIMWNGESALDENTPFTNKPIIIKTVNWIVLMTPISPNKK